MITIRHSLPKDLDAIIEIFHYARQFMKEHGNPNQWINGYPSAELILREITNGTNYVCENENGEIIGTFCFIPGEEDMRNRIAGIAVRFPYFVYEEEGKVVGYCYAHLWKERAAYRHTLETTVYLAPGYEGKGIGRELMERLIEECRRDGYRALIACVTEGNVVSDALHLRLGFKKVSHFKKVGLKFGRWLDVVDYELLLS